MTTTVNQPLTSIAERLTQQFYAWEKSGRGWQVHDETVRPEPPFEPFIAHYYTEPDPIVDDGRRPRLMSQLVKGIGSLLGGKTAVPQPVPPRQPTPDKAPEQDWITLRIQLAEDATPEMESFEQLLVTLGGCRGPVCFEIISAVQSIIIQIAVDRSEADQVMGQFAAYFPEVVVSSELIDGLYAAWHACGEAASLAVDFGLSREFMLPLSVHKNLPVDPYVSIMAALSQIQKGEMGVFQVLLEPARHAWAQSAWRAVTLSDGTAFFDDDPDFLLHAKEKIAKPLFAAVVRIAVASFDDDRTWAIAQGLAAALNQFANPLGNELIPLSNDRYDDAEHFVDVLSRQSHRSGMILSSEELASLVHLPNQDVRSDKLERLKARTRPAPAPVLGHSLVLGTNNHHGRLTPVTLSAEQRTRHMHVIGASGTGKSTFLLNLILQDIQQGQGIGVIDPHGDLIDQIVARIPESRIKDVVLVDPSDEHFPIGFNILSAHSDLERNLLASDLVAVFRRFSMSWGDQMGSVLSNAVLAFLESSQGGTLSDLRRFLIEPAFRTEFLTTVQDDYVRYYWKKEFPLLSGRPQAPLLTRLDTFLRPKPVRYMVSQKESRLNFAQIMDTGKIFLAKLAQGAIGEENASLLGSLFVSKFHQLALGRQFQSEQARRHFFLYCDEFGGYVTPSMAKLLSGARKFRLGLVLSHQELQQVHDEDVAGALMANAGTRICFRIGDDDAKSLANGFAHFEAVDLCNLGIGEAIGRVGKADDDFNFSAQRIADVPTDAAQERQNAVIAHTRATYATERTLVEATFACDREDATQPVQAPAKPPAKVPPPATKTEASEPEVEHTVEAVAASTPEPLVLPTPTPAPRPKKLRPMPPAVAPMGKGGTRHKYLQHLVSQCGQQRGWRATIEMPVKDGSVDVVLERENRRIAVEISVTTTVEMELGNLCKCLAAGFTEIVMLSEEPKSLANLKRAAEKEISKGALMAVKFLNLEQFVADDEVLAEERMPEEQVVRGYKVRVQREQPSNGDGDARRRAIATVLAKSMQKRVQQS